MATGGAIRVREHNLERTLRAIQVRGASTTAQLVQDTGLSRPSVNSLVAELAGLGWVEAIEPVLDGQEGRPPQRFRFRREVGLLMGLDVGAHRISALLTDLDGNVLAAHETVVDPALQPAPRLTAIDETIATVLERHGSAPGQVWAAAAAVTGPVDETGRTSLFSPLPGWTEVDLVGHLARTFCCPIAVENDVKLGLLAEQEWGVTRGTREAVYILAGLRPGAAAVVDGKLVKGHGGAAGEIGALPVVRWHNAIEILRELVEVPEDLDDGGIPSWTFERARRGDAAARKVVRKYARAVATGAAALVLTLDPEIVVLGGGNTAWADLWVPEFSAAVGRSVIRMPEVRVSTLGGDHVARGAIRLAMTTIEESHMSGRVLPARPGHAAQ